MNFFTPDNLFNQVVSALLITGAGILVFYLLFFLLKRWSRSKKHFLPRLIDKNLHLPGLLLFIAITLLIDLNIFQDYFGKVAAGNLRHGLKIILIIASGFFLTRSVSLTRD